MIHKRLTLETYIEGILNHERTILGRAITLVESNKSEDKALTYQLLDNPLRGN